MQQLGATKPLDDVVDMSSLKSSMVPGTLEAGTIDGKLYGLIVSANVKGLIWYPKVAWQKAGYPTQVKDIPALEQLTDQIKSDGGTPWCMGVQDPGGASGWPATDWFETLIMKQNGADVYNQWVQHKIPFSSSQVQQAASEFSKLLFTSGNTPGGQSAIASTNWQTAATPMFTPAAEVLDVHAGLVHHRLLPEERHQQPRRQRRVSWASRRPPPVARTRSKVVAT